MELNKIYNMDALNGLKHVETESIDAIVSDPPYQLDSINKRFGKEGSAEAQYGNDGSFQRLTKGFMNKEWDVLPSVELLKECLRVLKSGAFSMWLMTPRQDSQLEFLLRLREAGFVISFTPVYWNYLTGFPKAQNISKMVDKKLGYNEEVVGKGRSGAKETHHVMNMAYEEGKTSSLMGGEYSITKPVSDEAKRLDKSFSGFQPKPAVEVIIVAMKPLSEKSYVEQALKNKHGVTWLGNCRIPYESDSDFKKRKRGKLKSPPRGRNGIYGTDRNGGIVDTDLYLDKNGRFPANLLVSDNVLDIKSDGALAPVKSGQKGFGGNIYGKYKTGGDDGRTFYSDMETDKSVSRYFSLDAWWDKKIKELPLDVQKTFPFIYVPKASKTERNIGLDKLPEKNREGTATNSPDETGKFPEHDIRRTKNIHPTVKPIKLMSYLITLTTQENDIVLDPFMGSGTTAISSFVLNRRFIGFERENEYFDIANARIDFYTSRKVLFEMVKIKEEIIPTKKNINSIGMFLESEDGN